MPTTKTNPTVGPMNNDAAAIATLNIRVTGIEGRVSELASTVNGVQAALSSKIDTLATSLSTKIDDRGKTPWAIYISGIMAVFSLYAYIDNSKIGPLKEKDTAIDQRMDRIANKMESEMVPLWVHQRMWSLQDDIVKRVTDGNTERIKRVEDQFGNAYNMRDAIQQLDSRIQHFERMSGDKMKAP